MLPKNNSFRFINFYIGLLCSLGLVFIAFEWQTTEITLKTPYAPHVVNNIPEEILPITYRNKEIPKPKIPKPVIYDIFEVVDNIDPIEDIPDIIDEPIIEEESVFIPDNAMGGDVEQPEETPLFVVENMPEFPGGLQALRAYLAKNTKYPALAQEYGVEGTVLVKFVVWKDGSIRNVEVVRSIHPDLDAEAVRVVKQMPKWKPGSQQGNNVAVFFHLPVKFMIQ